MIHLFIIKDKTFGSLFHFYELHFLVACTQLYTPLCPSVRRSVRPSHFTFSALMGFLALLLLPKCSTDLNYGPYPPARDWGSHVSGLVFSHSHLGHMHMTLHPTSNIFTGTKHFHLFLSMSIPPLLLLICLSLSLSLSSSYHASLIPTFNFDSIGSCKFLPYLSGLVCF